MRARRSRWTLFALSAVILAAGIALVALVPRWERAGGGDNVPGTESVDPLRGDIYPDSGRGASDLETALTQAAREHKRIIVVFGGNWCGDCRVLNIYLHDPAKVALLNTNYVLVNINVGELDRNLDLAARFGVPVQRGVPALVVLNSSGGLIYRQHSGEAEAMSRTDSPSAVNEFLRKWRG
jgi:thiol:disulfide interchange protein